MCENFEFKQNKKLMLFNGNFVSDWILKVSWNLRKFQTNINEIAINLEQFFTFSLLLQAFEFQFVFLKMYQLQINN